MKELNYTSILVGYHDPRVPFNDGMVPYGMFLELTGGILGVWVTDMAGHMNLPRAAGLVVDRTFDLIFDTLEAGPPHLTSAFEKCTSTHGPVHAMRCNSGKSSQLGISLVLSSYVSELDLGLQKAWLSLHTDIPDFLKEARISKDGKSESGSVDELVARFA